MINILDNPHLPSSREWHEATAESELLHPLLKQFPNLKTVIDYGRWAPSGDNMQPWRFKLVDEFHFDIHGFDTRKHCVYDLNGHASQLALGMLIENLSLGAAVVGQKLEYQLARGTEPEKPVMHIYLTVIEPQDVDEMVILSTKKALAAQVILRTVHRRPLSRQKISAADKKILEQAVRPLKVQWFEGWDLLKTTRLFYDAAGIRLRIPEAFSTHSSIMEWNGDYSRDKMPVKTLGASWVAQQLMYFALKSWKRVDFLNRYLAGTLVPRIELDVIPALFSGAHFILIDDKACDTVADFLDRGRLVQQFWLTASSLGIQLQPQMTPLIFSNYSRLSINFTMDSKQLRASERLETALKSIIQADNVAEGVFIGRLGYGDCAKSRSTRLGLSTLVVE